MRMRTSPSAVAIVALVIGTAIGYVDSRPTWDDTGITVGVVLVAAGALAFFRPRTWWLVGLLVGLPIPIFNVLLRGNLQSAVALLIALAAAVIGAAISKALRFPGEEQRTGS